MSRANGPYAALPPVPTSIAVGGETLDLTPIRLGELPAFARAVQPVANHLSASPDWLALVSQHGETVIEAVSIAVRRPREWVAGLELDEAVQLASAVFEVNADFFMRRLAPAIGQATAKLGALMQSQTALQRLIGAGHGYREAMGYTLAQTEALLAAIDRQEARRLSSLLTVIATGAQGNSQAIRQALKELSS